MALSKRASSVLAIAGVLILILVVITLGPMIRGFESPPNIVIIMLDTVRADAVGRTWHGVPLTPHIDRLATQGTRFVKAFAPAPWTLPSHASLFTGLYPHRHHTVHESFELSESLTTMAELLRQRGYDTAGFTCNPWLHARGGMQQGFDPYVEVYKHDAGEPDKGARLATQMAIRWLQQPAEDDRPFLLFINYLEAHLPYEPPAETLDRLESGSAAAPRRSFSLEQAERYIAGIDELSPDDLDQVRRLYYAEVAYLDNQVAVLLDHLRSRGDLDDTVVIITSDHGEHLGTHRLMGHEFTLFDPALRIPLIVRYPRKFPRAAEITAPVSLVDILPTLLDILGVDDLTPAPDGQSLLDVLRQPQDHDRRILAQYARPKTLVNNYWRSKHPAADMSRYDVSLVALRKGDFKYTRTGDGAEQLYDLASDPAETLNLADDSPDLLAQLRAELDELTAAP
jgi:arylsulfatase A-like enzyme